ncbi:uncharacterized protein EI90DRAFT_643170 [Cantharellus anzutake]|uniref:uncharacterized protein n=1 Tax=Cantharellus anzutake TaxID=1750568 RepID=UPI001905500C|nr:uncharacterized protein EI90DRAFT_643170 [Cantharellus anzutake]KAF8333234.1 hypothetical protein EI90DRAFT_643170 [Cantharellus anzutake]
MADRSKSSRLFSRLSKRRHSSKPLSSPSQALTSPFPDIQITPVSGDRDESDGSLLHLPTATTQTGGDSQTFFRHTLSGLFRRSSSSGSSRVDQSPLSGPPNKSLPLSPHLGATNNIPRDTPIERVTHDNTAGHLQLGRTGVDLDISSLMERIPSSSAVPTGDRKKTTIAATRLVLQTAASALRFVPIANLDQIPNILLTWLQVYESVDDNDENLKGLGDEVRKAHETIFRPLQLWTGQVPHEISDVIQQFNSALQGLLERIEALKRQKLAKRVIRATEITQEVSSVKSCIGDAISRFTTAATTLNLLHTIRLSVDYELLKLHKVDAQYSSVISRSECLESTRVEIQRSILDRLKERGHRFVWLRGSPGTGKTAISTSVASTLDKRNHLAASFFWDKNQKGTGLDSIKYFPSTLARQLASFNAEYEGLLVSHLRQPLSLKIVPDSVLEKQMKAWIIDPMHELKSILSSSDGRFGIVLDGLDECGTQEELECLMKLVLILDELPAAFAVLVSCRPESSVTSAWGRARSRGLVIPCEDVDALAKGEKFHTVRRIVEEGLRNRIEESLWKPSGEDLDAFAFACRELPVIASTRVRDVCLQTRRGATLESEFKYFRDLTNAPVDVNSEYLRVLRRAYVVDSSGVRPQTAKKYFQVVGTIIAAHEPLSVFSMSQLLGMSEEEVLAILEPISSLVDLSQVSRSERSSGNPPVDAKSVIFYHATMKEFITGDPIGNENDRVFFFKDVKGYFLGLPLLRFLNNSTPDVFGMPTTPPLGDEQKWKDFREFHRPYHHPQHLQYAIKYLFRHLDPSQLFAQDNDLQNEFNTFLVRNLVTFMLLAQFDFVLPAEFRPFNVSENHS